MFGSVSPDLGQSYQTCRCCPTDLEKVERVSPRALACADMAASSGELGPVSCLSTRFAQENGVLWHSQP